MMCEALGLRGADVCDGSTILTPFQSGVVKQKGLGVLDFW